MPTLTYLRDKVQALTVLFGTTEQRSMDQRFRFCRKLNSMLTDCDTSFEKFSNNFETNPRYAFEWSEAAMQNASLLELIAGSIAMMEGGHTLAVIQKEWMDCFLQEVDQGSSSSHAHNAMHSYKLKAYRKFLQQLQYCIA